MRNKSFLHPATLFFLLFLCLVLCSWVGSGYGWKGVQNLLSVDGVRWMLRHVEENLMCSPALACVCMLFFGCGLVVHSGLSDAIYRLVVKGRKLSRKQKRALFFSGIVGALYIAVCFVLAWGPWGIVRSVTGMFHGSPLEDGMLFVVSLGIGILGTVYGFAVDNYRRDKDVFKGMSCLFARFAEYFVSLFFIVQFFAALEYSGLLTFWDVSSDLIALFYTISCIFPFFFC